jgi:hypothetical protein
MNPDLAFTRGAAEFVAWKSRYNSRLLSHALAASGCAGAISLELGIASARLCVDLHGRIKDYLRRYLRGPSSDNGFIAPRLLACLLAFLVLAGGCTKANLSPKGGADGGDAGGGGQSGRDDASVAKSDASAASKCSDAGSGTKGNAEACSCDNECRSGYCVGGVCCGTCDSKTGCSNPVGNLGSACDDQATDRCCRAGVCVGAGIGQCL